VQEAQRQISAPEFLLWKALYQIDPFGDDWLQAATITTAALAPWTKRKLDPSQFIPGRQTQRRQTPEEVKHRLELFFSNFEARQDE